MIIEYYGLRKEPGDTVSSFIICGTFIFPILVYVALSAYTNIGFIGKSMLSILVFFIFAILVGRDAERAFNELTTIEHLQQGCELIEHNQGLIDQYESGTNKTPEDIDKLKDDFNFDEAEKHLMAISSDDANYNKAKESLEKLNRQKQIIENLSPTSPEDIKPSHTGGSCNPGDICVIINDGGLGSIATSKSNWKQFGECITNDDTEGILLMASQEKIIAVDDGTKVRFLDICSVWGNTAKIRILSGEYAGVVGYCLTNALHKTKT